MKIKKYKSVCSDNENEYPKNIHSQTKMKNKVRSTSQFMNMIKYESICSDHENEYAKNTLPQ